jgi:hypothetical protein
MNNASHRSSTHEGKREREQEREIYTDTDIEDRKLHVRNCKMSGFENGRHASRELELEGHVLNTLHEKAHEIVFHLSLCLCEREEKKRERRKGREKSLVKRSVTADSCRFSGRLKWQNHSYLLPTCAILHHPTGLLCHGMRLPFYSFLSCVMDEKIFQGLEFPSSPVLSSDSLMDERQTSLQMKRFRDSGFSFSVSLSSLFSLYYG